MTPTEEVTQAVAYLFRARGHAVFGQARSGPGSRLQPTRILDLVAIEHKWAGIVHGIEIKASRSDFTGDHKWPEYLPMCNRFWWACPAGLIEKTEIAREAGLIWYEAEARSCHIVKWAKRRSIGPDWRVLLGLLWRGRGETRAETIARIKAEMAENRYVGAHYRAFVAKRLTLAAKRERTLRDEIRNLKTELYRAQKGLTA